ncbi:MAG: hypothetical protein AABX32_01420 [Nanoarchaeota archaeon]
MKKTIALTIMAIFILSLVPLAVADTDVAVNSDTSVDSETSSGSSDSSNVRVISTTSVRADTQENDNKSQRENMKDRLEKMRENSEKRLEKIAELDQKQRERLSKLNVTNLDKIMQLKSDRLEKLSELSDEKLEKIAELDQEKLEKISELNRSDIQKFLELNRARSKELAKMDFQALKMELKGINMLKVRNAHDLDERNLTQSVILKARADFEAAKEKFKESKDGLEGAREKLKESKEKRDDNATIENARDYLLKVSDALVSHLEKIKAKVQENSNIEANVSARIVAEIDAQIADINSIKADVQSATTKEQIKEDASRLRKKWNTLEHLVELYSKRVVSARVEGIVNQGLVLEKRLDHVLQEAKDKNISINVSAEVDLFSQKIAESKDKYTQAQAKLSEALNLRAGGEPADSSKIKALTDEANRLLKESRELIKQAHDELKIIVKEIKGAYPDADLSEDVEVEVEQESD